MKETERGFAILESLPVMGVFIAFLLGILMVAYLMFTRAWIQYQSEQALYCAAEGKYTLLCREELERKVHQFLPWGETHARVTSLQQKWNVEIEWKYRNYAFHFHKELNPDLVLRTKALRW